MAQERRFITDYGTPNDVSVSRDDGRIFFHVPTTADDAFATEDTNKNLVRAYTYRMFDTNGELLDNEQLFLMDPEQTRGRLEDGRLGPWPSSTEYRYVRATGEYAPFGNETQSEQSLSEVQRQFQQRNVPAPDDYRSRRNIEHDAGYRSIPATGVNSLIPPAPNTPPRPDGRPGLVQ